MGAAGDVATPTALLDAFIATFETQVVACVADADACPEDPSGAALPLYVTPSGHDLSQLVEKHLLGAVHYSQGTDDYLDDDPADEGKGLLAQNVMPKGEGDPYTDLEHHWDEAFGYYGAAVDLGDYTDDEVRAAGGRDGYSGGYHDFDGDGCIDVYSEINFTASTNAAKRDAGATTDIDLSTQVFDAFVAGRHIITTADDALDDTEMAALRVERDRVVDGWERALSATLVHYINEVTADMEACGSDDYAFADHAKHWSELKGFALALQYNPRSPFRAETSAFAALHAQVGDAPTTCDGDTATYTTRLTQARDSLAEAYDFDDADVQNW
jgi:hypothetical protein